MFEGLEPSFLTYKPVPAVPPPDVFHIFRFQIQFLFHSVKNVRRMLKETLLGLHLRLLEPETSAMMSCPCGYYYFFPEHFCYTVWVGLRDV